ncbi:hypothetical protein SAMN02910293_00063 [Streptococcus henryi]|uniref:Uncharacterized protein n=1 Tax=Streptococcus henryi TaxID=439219 RepID=A0A1G5ZZY0_9STRE|nr:hypothetical protein [Streptococcus henryi]SDB01727.1 hypothetical protein SAMN02910293_00063 [Streptococcus henryi]
MLTLSIKVWAERKLKVGKIQKWVGTAFGFLELCENHELFHVKSMKRPVRVDGMFLLVKEGAMG